MLARIRDARLIVPTLLTLTGLAILTSLGNWQWQRKTWKEGLIAQITDRSKAPPVSLAEALDAFERTGGDIEYLHVTVSGRFLHDKERFFYAPAPGTSGWHVLTPLETTAGRRVWINRGFVPDRLRDPAERAAGQITGPVEVRGLARLTTPPANFTPDNDPARNIWYRRDIPALDASAFPAGPPSAPFLVEAEAGEAPGAWPKGGVTRLALPNRHLEYALTWWGLAGTLLAVYVVYAFGRLRRGAEAPDRVV